MGGKRNSCGITMQDIIVKRNDTRVQTNVLDAAINDLPPQILSSQQPYVQNQSQSYVPNQLNSLTQPQIQANGQPEPNLQRSNMISSTKGVSRGQGAARPCNEWGSGTRLRVRFNANSRIAGPGKKKLQSALGVLARNSSKVSLTYPSFFYMTSYIIDDIWKEVQEIAKKNKKHRALLRYPHRTGRTDFDDVIDVMKAFGMDTSCLDIFIATHMPKNGILLDDNRRILFENIKERLSQVLEEDDIGALNKQVFNGLITQEGHGRMLCLGRGAHPIELQCISTPTPITLDSISEVLQILIQKAGEKLQSKARAKGRAEVTSGLENFFTTIVAEANQASHMTLRGEYNVNRQVHHFHSYD
ncbi:hypothetical protein ACH5RR_037109 [Cinchona calisaya]|uniref:Uncharacterized protein n=1 Tax=Cinchona calisaya TaxID=153742 RepID=A0ABD2YA09_9GENT